MIITGYIVGPPFIQLLATAINIESLNIFKLPKEALYITFTIV